MPDLPANWRPDIMPLPWSRGEYGDTILDLNGHIVAENLYNADTEHIIACVKFCAGFSAQRLNEFGYENLAALLEANAGLLAKYDAEIDYEIAGAPHAISHQYGDDWMDDKMELADHLALIAVLRGEIVPLNEKARP